MTKVIHEDWRSKDWTTGTGDQRARTSMSKRMGVSVVSSGALGKREVGANDLDANSSRTRSEGCCGLPDVAHTGETCRSPMGECSGPTKSATMKLSRDGERGLRYLGLKHARCVITVAPTPN
jgi:hypothetical protein